MTIPSPNELHQRLKNDPRADIGQIVIGDRMCVLVTYANGDQGLAADFIIGQADSRIGDMIDDLIIQDVSESESDADVSPVVGVEIIHLCRVLLDWQLWPEEGCWARETALVATVSGQSFSVRINAVEVERARIDLRAEMDKDLIAAGWRLL